MIRRDQESKMEEYNCRRTGCKLPDSAENMVACDLCERWFHFTCAGVSESVSDKSFICTDCEAAKERRTTERVRSVKSHATSASGNELELQQLEQEKRLRERMMAERKELEEKFLKEKTAMEAEFLQRKFRLEQI